MMNRRGVIVTAGILLCSGCLSDEDYDGCIGAREISSVFARRFLDDEPEGVTVSDEDEVLENEVVETAVRELFDQGGEITRTSRYGRFEKFDVTQSDVSERELHDATCHLASLPPEGGGAYIRYESEIVEISFDALD